MEKLGNFTSSKFCIVINIDKFILLKFFQKCTVWEITSLAKKFGKGVKMTKLSFPYCCIFLLEHHIGNMRVVINSLSSLLFMSHAKFSLVPNIFTSTSDGIWFLGLIAP
jgi:hypothetical protein